MYSIPFVVLMGMGIVFVGLISIIFLTMAMSAILREKRTSVPAVQPSVSEGSAVVKKPEEDTKFIAAVFSILADDLHMDISNAKITVTKM